MGGFKWAGGAVQAAQVVAVSPFDCGSTAPSARTIRRDQRWMETKAQFRSSPIDDICRRKMWQHAPVRQAMSAPAMSGREWDDKYSHQCTVTGVFLRHPLKKKRQEGAQTIFNSKRQQ
jgi:hypothetical protein